MIYKRISVITPSFNQGKFIEQTILSVIGQHYPNLEYIIIDGGSSDETLEIIKKYEDHITHWVSEPDTGQSNAINKGFSLATGDILCWLNSDDYYLPGTLLDIAKRLSDRDIDLVFGNCVHLDEEKNLSYGSFFDPLKSWDIRHGDFIAQPSSFWTKRVYDLVGPLREDLHFGFDWEWYARAHANGVNFIPSARYYSIYRVHSHQKSNDDNIERFIELTEIERQLNPEKLIKIDNYLQRHITSIGLIYKLTGVGLLIPLRSRILRAIHPKLLQLIDPISLKKYLLHSFTNKNQ